MPVSLGLANEDGYSREGMVDSVDNRIDTNSGTIRVRARFDNADGALLPGLYARVKVGGGTPHPAVLIDDAAIGTDQDKKYVMVVDKDNRVQYREVTLGHAAGRPARHHEGSCSGRAHRRERLAARASERCREGERRLDGDTTRPLPRRLPKGRQQERQTSGVTSAALRQKQLS